MGSGPSDMKPAAQLASDLVLVGGGHAHALALRMLAMAPVAGLRITLVSPATHTPYSGMLPGLLAGHYSFAETHIDLAALCAWAGVRFIRTSITGLDPQQKTIAFSDRPPLTYDALSIDIGSQPDTASVPGAAEFSTPVKPVAALWSRWQNTLSGLESGARLAIVGGGAGSVELALAIAHVLSERNLAIDLYCGAPQILQGYNPRARRRVERALIDHGVHLHVDHRVARVKANALYLQGGAKAHYDELLWCTGASASPWLSDSGLPVDDRGFLAITDTLQSTGSAAVFAVGDCATQINHPRPKAGVYAVRQGPVLANNLRAYVLGQPLKSHAPQKRFLSLLSLGDKLAVADRGPFSASGAWVWRWKDRIDREFMRRFSHPPVMPDTTPSSSVPAANPIQAPCGGCGAKLAPAELSAVLAGLRQLYPKATQADNGPTLGSDDAAVVMTPEPMLLQSVDSLRALVSDPYLMGQIAANHALSDLYACGSTPVSAQALVTLPFSTAHVGAGDLEQMLAGSLSIFEKAGCVLLGGHSMQGPECQLGFVVNGLSGERSLPKHGLRPGDSLILTKPLGTGLLFAAQMQGRADGGDIEAAIESMLVSNAVGAQLAVEHGATAVTDVTGFGLAGHLIEMLGEEAGASLNLAAVNLLPGANEAITTGIHSSGFAGNYALVADRCEADVAVTDAAAILFDPQTSGGLLIGVSADRSRALVQALNDQGIEGAVIGVVTESPALVWA